MAQQFTPSDVQKVAVLANIPVSDQQAASLAEGFTKTMTVVEQLNSLDTSTVEAAHHVTGLENIMREDEVDEARMFTQAQALQNAPRQHNGFFVVDQVIEQE